MSTPVMSPDALVGSWRLQSWRITRDDRDTVSYPFGEAPEGLLVYTPDGWMTASISRPARQAFPTDRPYRSIDAQDLAAAFSSYFHYAARYRIEGDTVIHSVVQSLNPNFPGTEQHRKIDLQGDRLVLSGVEVAGEQTRRHTLVWLRSGA
jgi:hypothetical protein